MKNNTTRLLSRFNIFFFLMLISLLSITLFSSCEEIDDTPPVSAYVEPEPDAPIENTIEAPSFSTVPVDFESANPEFEGFGQKDGDIVITVGENPASDGINTSNKVIQVVQTPGTEPWAGFLFDLAVKVDFSANRTIKIKVYSPAEGQNVTLKLEDIADSTINKEVTATTTVANTWEELYFVFAESDNDKYDRAVLFFNFLGPKDVETTHYFDDIVMVEGDGNPDVGNTDEPTMAAPTPIIPETGVISMFSDAYTDVAVDTWRTPWSDVTLEDIDVEGNAVKKYSDLSFVGIETTTTNIDASSMTHFRTDIWTADATELKIKLVDFGADGAFDGGDDVEHEITVPTFAQGEWVSLDIPLSDFTGLTTKANIGQLIYVGAPSQANTIFIDNVYFYNDGFTAATEPTSAAPTPSQMESDVISMFSDAYTDVTVDTWRTPWSDATLEDIAVAGDAVKKYSALSFVGIETTTTNIDASSMTHFRTDIWTADATEFKIKLVDFGADGAFEGGDDVEHEITVSSPGQGEWVSLDIPLSDFTGLTSKANIAQLIYVGAPAQANTVFVDNVYFYNDSSSVATEPTSAAPTPTIPEADVISMFSDAYTDVTVDTWRTPWSDATLEDIAVAGDAVKKYSALSFVGIETTTTNIDASSMTHFRTDIWTADATELKIKLVDFGADGAFDGGDDVEHEITIATPGQGQWVSLDIPLSDFTGLTTKANIAQLIYVGAPSQANTVFVDNVYFHK